MKGKRSQEEMVGFILIIILVSVIILVFLGFLLKSPKKESVQSYEIQSFLQSVLQFTSTCEDYLGFLSIEKLIIKCEEGENCLNEEDSCVVLNNTLNDLAEKNWVVGENSPIKGYELKVFFGDDSDKIEKINLKEGNETGSYKGDFVDFSGKGRDYEILFKAYYND